MILSRVSLAIMMLYSNIALSAPFYRKCTFINSQQPPFDLIIDLEKRLIIINGDKAGGAFMIEDNEIGVACDRKVIPCGSIALNLKGDILGKHTVKVDKNRLYFSAQSTGDDKLFNAYDIKTGVIMFGSIAMTPAFCNPNNE